MPIPANKLISRSNALGFFRLLFAFLVIVSHTPELLDGDRHREILTCLFGTLSFGEVAVDGFFLISGFLIVHSYTVCINLREFVLKRIGRIYPGYLVALLLSYVFVAPLGGANIEFLFKNLPQYVIRMLVLRSNVNLNVFAGSHYPLLNGAIWTIPYELACYILVIVLGGLGVYRRKSYFVITLAISMLLFLISSGAFQPYLVLTSGISKSIIFFLTPFFRLSLMFMIGGLFYIFRETINYHKCKALLAAMLLLFFMLYSNFAELAFGIFGGYLIFGFAFFWSSPLIRSINRETDISFGVYLYGWPITKVLIFIIPDSGPLIINILSLALAAFFGLVSWNFIEKPAQAIFRRAAHGQNLFLTDQVK